MKESIKILVVDDHEVILYSVEQIISESRNVVFYKAHTKDEMLANLFTTFIDVIILDVNVNGINMLNYVKEIKSIRPNIKVIIFSSYDSQYYVNDAFENDVNAYILKNSRIDEILYAYDQVIDGKRYYFGDFHHVKRKVNLNDSFLLKQKITTREVEVLMLLAKGYTNSRMSRELNISIHTLLTHRKNLFKKLKVNTINELIALAYNSEIIKVS